MLRRHKNVAQHFVMLATLSGLAALLPLQSAFAAGLEKADFWDAHSSALGSAVQSSIDGPAALYWNPAGLAGLQGLQINANFSATDAGFKGPFQANTSINSNSLFIPVAAGFIGYGVTPSLGAGIGYYVSGGNKAEYGNVDLGQESNGITYNPLIKGDLTITELSAGAGFEIMPGLKLGAAYRMVFVSGELDSASATLNGAGLFITGVQVTDIKATEGTGLRVGLQYAPKDSNFGFGLVYRNRVHFAASSTANVTTAGSTGNLAGVPGAGVSSSGGNPIVSGQLPQRIDAGLHYHFTPDFTTYLGYSFSNYAQEQVLGLSGLVTSGGTINADTPLGWNNQQNIRLGFENTGLIKEWPVRLGLVYTNEVTPKNSASPVFAAPGAGYTIVAGTGHNFSSNFKVDGAFEYSWDSGSVAASDNPNSGTVVGDYGAHSYVLHLSANYAF